MQIHDYFNGDTITHTQVIMFFFFKFRNHLSPTAVLCTTDIYDTFCIIHSFHLGMFFLIVRNSEINPKIEFESSSEINHFLFFFLRFPR